MFGCSDDSYVLRCADEYPEFFAAGISRFEYKAFNGLLTEHELQLWHDGILDYVKEMDSDITYRLEIRGLPTDMEAAAASDSVRVQVRYGEYCLCEYY